MLTQLDYPLSTCYDIRQANDVERRPGATYVRVAPALNAKVLDSLSAFSGRNSVVGAFEITKAPAPGTSEADELISFFGTQTVLAVEHDNRNRSLRTFGAGSDTAPDFVFVFARSAMKVRVADFAGIWWRLTRRDLDFLRDPSFHIGQKWRGPLVCGDPGVPFLRYDQAITTADSCESAHALSTLDLAILLPGIMIDLILEPHSLLILDNRRMLVSADTGNQGCVLGDIVPTMRNPTIPMTDSELM